LDCSFVYDLPSLGSIVAEIEGVFIPPKIGDEVYVPNEWSINDERDDIEGGLKEIDYIELKSSLPENHINHCFVSFKGYPNTKLWNYRVLMSRQDELRELF